MTINNDIFEEFQKIMSDLLESTDASRTTLRLDLPDHDLTIDTVIAEGTAPGVKSLKGSTSITNLRKTVATVEYMDECLEMLVQNDCKTAVPAAPKHLIEHYGVKAQMLSPIVKNKKMIGVISVHYNIDTRQWSKQDIMSLNDATERVKNSLQIS